MWYIKISFYKIKYNIEGRWKKWKQSLRQRLLWLAWSEEELLVLFQEQERLIAKLGSLIKNDRIKEIKERRAEIEKEIIKEIELPVETQHEMQQKIDRLLIYIGELREHNKRLAIKMEIKLKRQENQEYLI